MELRKLLVICLLFVISQCLAIQTKQITVKKNNMSFSIDSEPPSGILKKRAEG